MKASVDSHAREGPADDEVSALLPERRRSGDDGWHVLHVMSRQEKALSRILVSQGTHHYLPLVSEARCHGSRRVRVNLPLFPGYLFLWGTRDEAFEADRTRRVVNLIRVLNQDGLERELDDLYRALSQGAPLTANEAIQVGERVKVRSGPFEGLAGRVSRRSGRSRLVLQVTTLGCAASLDIEGALTEAID